MSTHEVEKHTLADADTSMVDNLNWVPLAAIDVFRTLDKFVAGLLSKKQEVRRLGSL